MSERLEIKVDGNDVKAEAMLDIAKRTIRLLRAIERNQTGKRRSVVNWRVGMLSGYSYGLIEIWADSAKGEAPERAQAVWKEAEQLMREASK